MTARVDPHVKVLDETVVERAKTRGLDAVVYAPHFERVDAIRERAAAFSDDDLAVIPARELFTGTWRNRRHVLGIGLSEPIPDFITLDAAMDELQRQGAAVLVPHPGFLNVSLDAADVRAYRDRIHAIETYNPKQRAVGETEAARDLAASVDRPGFGSSYAHLSGTVGEVWTEIDAEIHTGDDLVAALRDGAPRRVYHRDGATHDARCAIEFAHLGWENSWGKAERVLLSGMEATHPGHLAYDGRFDDVAAY